MKNLFPRIWNAEPVVFVSSLTAAWVATVAFDQGMDTWEIPLVAYVVAVPVVAFLGGIVRSKVTPTG